MASSQSIAELREIFQQFDTDGTGSIDAQEVVAALSKLGIKISRAELQALMEEADDNGDGVIDFDEFMMLHDRGSSSVLVNFNEYGQDIAQKMSNTTLTMYHGCSRSTANKIEEYGFIPSKGGLLGAGVYLVDEGNRLKAMRFAHDEFFRAKGSEWECDRKEPVIIECQVNVGKVFYSLAGRDGWQDRGYDSAWAMRTSLSGSSEWCVANPSRIRVIAVWDITKLKCPWGRLGCPYEKRLEKAEVAHGKASHVARTPWGGGCPCRSGVYGPPGKKSTCPLCGGRVRGAGPYCYPHDDGGCCGRNQCQAASVLNRGARCPWPCHGGTTKCSYHGNNGLKCPLCSRGVAGKGPYCAYDGQCCGYKQCQSMNGQVRCPWPCSDGPRCLFHK